MMTLFESAYVGARSQSPHQPPTQSQHEERTYRDDYVSSLNKPNSIFSLTLDEIQLKSGKPFGSMNMDEFLTNLWSSVDDNLVPLDADPHIEPINNNVIECQQPYATTLRRQNSFSIPIQISKKTVEEVWSDIQKDQPQKLDNVSNREPPLRQATFGEITLEDFLIKAGVVQEPSKPSQPKIVPPPPIQNNNTCLDASFGMGPIMGLGFATHPNMGNNFLANGYATYPIYAPTKRNAGAEILPSNAESAERTSLGPLGTVEASGLKNNKKRIIDGPPEVVVERRQRRMIKNRESAARSRARKQAYTVELEVELNQLREENEKLKQIVKEFEQKGAHEILKMMKTRMGLIKKDEEDS